jgi:hypothetical protein
VRAFALQNNSTHLVHHQKTNLTTVLFVAVAAALAAVASADTTGTTLRGFTFTSDVGCEFFLKCPRHNTLHAFRLGKRLGGLGIP